MRHLIILLTALISLTSCEGVYIATGTVYQTQDGIKKPLDNTVVKVYCCSDWLRGTTLTDTAGHFTMQGLTTPTKTMYYITFERPQFKTDTIRVKGDRGKTIIEVEKELKRNDQ